MISRFGISVPADSVVIVSGMVIASGMSGSVFVLSFGVSSSRRSSSLLVGIAWRWARPVVAMVAARAWQKVEICCWRLVLVGMSKWWNMLYIFPVQMVYRMNRRNRGKKSGTEVSFSQSIVQGFGCRSHAYVTRQTQSAQVNPFGWIGAVSFRRGVVRLMDGIVAWIALSRIFRLPVSPAES